jgi:hypothetical protein
MSARPKFSKDEPEALDPDAAWKNLLDPFGRRWTAFENGLDRDLEQLSDDELAALLGATYKVTSTNCWYGSFGVAPVLRDAIHRVRFTRKLAREGTS